MLFTIGQVTKMYDISHDTLRYYDKIDLLKPSVKKDNGYRYYTMREIEILEMILIAKQLEIPIKDIKEIIEKEDVNAYTELFKIHERIIEEKIKYLNKLKYQVKVSKNKSVMMSKFKNKELKEYPKYEHINKRVIFLKQDSGECISDLTKNKNLVTIAVKKKDSKLEFDKNIVGVEISEDEEFNYDEYKNYIEKEIKGEYIILTRKDTAISIDNFINKAIEKYKIKEDIKIIIEIIFVIIKKNKENIYFVKIYIPKT